MLHHLIGNDFIFSYTIFITHFFARLMAPSLIKPWVNKLLDNFTNLSCFRFLAYPKWMPHTWCFNWWLCILAFPSLKAPLTNLCSLALITIVDPQFISLLGPNWFPFIDAKNLLKRCKYN
jgi:hypothetical protein